MLFLSLFNIYVLKKNHSLYYKNKIFLKEVN